MAAVGSNPVSDELVRTHMQNWIAFTKFMKISTVAVGAVLVLLALITL